MMKNKMKQICPESFRDTSENENVIPRLDRGIQKDIDSRLRIAGMTGKGYFKVNIIKQLILIIMSVTLLTSCGGGGGSSSSGGSGTSVVTLTIGGDNQTANLKIEKNTIIAQIKLFIKELLRPDTAIAAIPSSVYKIAFTVSASDMETIKREVIVSGQSSITESFIVPNGGNRYFFVEAKDSTGTVLYEGSTYANLDGSDVTLDISMAVVGAALNAPTGGSASAGNQQVTVSWSTATDATSYNIYMASEAGVTKTNYSIKPDGKKYSSITTTSYTITGLTNSKTYYFVVTSADSLGESVESTEVSATPANEPPQPPRT